MAASIVQIVLVRTAGDSAVITLLIVYVLDAIVMVASIQRIAVVTGADDSEESTHQSATVGNAECAARKWRSYHTQTVVFAVSAAFWSAGLGDGTLPLGVRLNIRFATGAIFIGAPPERF